MASKGGGGLDASAQDVLSFWLDEVGPDGWFLRSDAVDAACRDRFGGVVASARTGALDGWARTPEGALALLIALDQLPRNIYRDDARAFAGDAHALQIARAAIAEGHDLAVGEPARLFFYMPFEHSEDIRDQDRAVALFTARMPRDDLIRHAVAHRDLIVRFGRFPHRNAVLGRTNTLAETAHLNSGGYRPGAAPADPQKT